MGEEPLWMGRLIEDLSVDDLRLAVRLLIIQLRRSQDLHKYIDWRAFAMDEIYRPDIT